MIKVKSDFYLETIMKSGQSFRLTQLGSEGVQDLSYRLIAFNRVLFITDLGDGHYDFQCGQDEYEKVWRSYFDLDTDYSNYHNCVEETDLYMTEAISHGRGMKILRQDAWETLISFILSQQKNIPAIRKAVETLCERYGDPIEPSEQAVCTKPLYAFPRPQRLKEAGIDGLRACGIGFRAKYVYDAACRVDDGELDLLRIANLSNDELKGALKTVYGVGDKIAACVMLFAYHRLNVFPVDVWIDRVVKEKYAGEFPFERYGDFAGVLQQYMFYYALSGGIE